MTNDVLNWTYQNVKLYVRDLTCDWHLLQRYQKNQILTDPSYIEMSYKLGGMLKEHNTRFCILSAHAMDMSELEHGTDWGLAVLPANSYFKVLSIFAIQNKTFIVLLQIKPEHQTFHIENKISIDEQFVELVKTKMKEVIHQKVVSFLKDDLWIKKVNFPIGLTLDGTFFH